MSDGLIARPRPARSSGAARPVARSTSAVAGRVEPVVIWAIVGGAGLAFQVYVLARWITGPYFRTVPSGPSVPPEWMKVTIVGWEIVSWPLLAACLYWALIRPCRRQRRLTTDGILCVVWLLLYFWEPLSNYFGNWFTYNSYAFNRGSWVAGVPGWHSFARPGAMVVEPFLWALPAYGYGLFMGTVLACATLRRVHRRWPRLPAVALCLICWGFMIVVDVLLEGLIWMPQQLFTTAGGVGQLTLDSHANRFALSEAVLWGAAWAAISCVRYFTDDRGRTIAERGLDRLRIRPAQHGLVRLLAVLGLCQVLYVGLYTVPSAIIGAQHRTWPRAISNSSYLTDHICGIDTSRRCRSQ